MKILLQTEAKTISNAELARNQKYLIDLIQKLNCIKFNWQHNFLCFFSFLTKHEH